jgi:hypothetical protein
MDIGAIAFYDHEARFKDILAHMKVSDLAFNLSDEDFENRYGYDLQSVFHTLYQSDDMWGFVAAIVNKKDGSTAYKIITKGDSLREVASDDVYFALKMDGYSYTHWAEMDSNNTVQVSKGGNRIFKKPSERVKRSAKNLDLKLFKDRMLYQVVETSASDWDNYYSMSNPNNSQWDKYTPYYAPQDTTMKSSMYGYYPTQNHPQQHYPPSNSRQQPRQQQSPWPNYYPQRKTRHAIPFLRDNIKPSTLSVMRQTKSCENQLCVFVNFPDGLPFLNP